MSAGRVMFWGGISSGSVGILGAIGALVILSGSAPSAKATAGLIGATSSESAVATPPETTASAKPTHATLDEERTDHEKGALLTPAAPLPTPAASPIVPPKPTGTGKVVVAAPAASAAGPQPDLLPSRITPAVLDASSAGRFGVVVRNSGRSVANGPFMVRVTVDGHDIYTMTYPNNVNSGGEVFVLVPRFKLPAPGPHKVQVCVDTGGEVREGSETNNCAGGAILVR